jgi:hypothetical protein
MNPTSGDASVFLPLEQTVLTQTVEPHRRTALFARYRLIGSVAGALGILAAAAPDLTANWAGCTRTTVTQLMFGFSGMLGITALLLYRPLSPAVEGGFDASDARLHRSRARLSDGGAVRHAFVRHRISGSIAARSAALSGLRHIGDDRRRDPVPEQHLLGNFLPRGRAYCRADWADQHDGVYRSAVPTSC